MIKRVIAALCGLSCLFCLVSCNEDQEKEGQILTGEGESFVRYDYDLSEYIRVPYYRNIPITCQNPEICTDEEVEDAVTQVLLSYATFEEKEGDDAVVEPFNRVKFDYRMYLEGKELEEYHEEDYVVVVSSDGYGDLDYAIGQALIGAKVRSEVETDYLVPENDAEIGAWAGKTVQLKAKVKKIEQHYLAELNDEFVSSLEGEGGTFSTVEEFRAAVREDILFKKETAMVNAVFETFMNSVEVIQYPEREVQYYVDLEWKSIQAISAQLTMPEEQYLSMYLGMDYALWEAQTRLSAKERVKSDMACIQLSRLLGTTLTEQEYIDGRQRFYEDVGGPEGSDFATVEEFEAHYTEREIRESILWEKSFGILVEEAVITEPK